MFSQWYPCRFNVENVAYNCAEQYMMAGKAIIFRDWITLCDIMMEDDPREQKKLGRGVRNFDNDTWLANARDIVYQGNLAKFSQNEYLRSKLLETGDAILVEASPYDKLWGIGIGEDHPDINNPDRWQGKNWLGEVLMRVRTTLRDAAQAEEEE